MYVHIYIIYILYIYYIYEGHSMNEGNFFSKSKERICFKNFFPNCKFYIFWNSVRTKTILIKQKYLFCCNSKWWQIKQNVPSLNRVLSNFFWWLRSANHVKFTEGTVMCMEKRVLVKKLFVNELKMSVLPQTWIEKTVWVKNTVWI